MFDHQLADAEKQSMRHLARTVVDQLAAGRPADEIVRELQNNGWEHDHATEFVSRIAENQGDFADTLELRFPDLKRTTSSPPLATINGFGTGFYGARDHDPETRTYVKTLCVSALWVPVIPLTAYRVARAPGDRGWYMVGRVPLSRFAKLWNVVLVLAIAGLIGGSIWTSHTNTPAYRARRNLSQANNALANGDLLKAARLYREVSLSGTPSSAEARDQIAQLIRRPDLETMPHHDVSDLFRYATEAVTFGSQAPGIVERGVTLARQYVKASPEDAMQLLRTIAPMARKQVAACLLQLLDEDLRNVPAAQVTRVYQAAWSVVSDPATDKAVADRALRWIKEHPQADPVGTLALADVLARVPDTDSARIHAIARQQLERAVAADPNNVETANRLAIELEKEGNDARVESVLMAVRDKLGQREGARILGQLLANKGQYEASYALLNPYLKARLARLHEAEDRFQQMMSVAQKHALESLKLGYAAGFDFEKYDNCSDEQKKQLVIDYINRYIKKDADVQKARTKLLDEASIVPVALDLGMVQLHRARAMTDPALRRKELERAEKVFLSVQSLAGDSDSYRINVGQVYYWLGKEKEGQQEFDQLMEKHKRAPEILLAVAKTLREIGADTQARQLAEEAYGSAKTDDIRHNAAGMRQVLCTSLSDKIIWLQRCDQSSSDTKAELETVRGHQAAEVNDDAEAARHFERAIAVYESVNETPATLNNGALAYFDLYNVNHDHATLEKGMDWIQRAVALSPSNPLVIANAADTILTAAIRDIAAPKVDLPRFSTSVTVSDLRLLATDNDALLDLRGQVRRHAGTRKAIDYLNRLIVLSPRKAQPYTMLQSIYGFTRDQKALEQLSGRLDDANLDITATREAYLKYYRLNQDPDARKAMEAELQRAEKKVRQTRDSKNVWEFAIAVQGYLGRQAMRRDAGAADVDALVELATAAHAKARSLATYQLMTMALLQRAGRTLAAKFPAYAKAVSTTSRSLTPSYSVVLILSRDDALGAAARANADVRHAATLVVEQAHAFPDLRNAWSWALLRSVQPDEADALAKFLAHDPVGHAKREVAHKVLPFVTTGVWDLYWEQQATGQADSARQTLEQTLKLDELIPRFFLPRADASAPDPAGAGPSKSKKTADASADRS